VSHRARAVLAERFPVHATWRMCDGLGSLRTGACVRLLRRAFLAASGERFQVVHHAIMGNHIHLIVEARDERALSRGMQGLGVRIARGVHRLQGRRGQALDGRYHAHVLATPMEVKRARLYLLDNARQHFGTRGADWCASQTAMRAPRTWLLRQANVAATWRAAEATSAAALTARITAAAAAPARATAAAVSSVMPPMATTGVPSWQTRAS
jgi:putative transposase